MSNLTVRPINTGFVTMIPKQYLYHHSTVAFYPEASDQEEEYPVFTYLVEGGGKLLLVDTGMAYTERADKYHHHGSHQPEGMSIVEQLAALGYKPEEIDIVVFTHLHWDHCFYMEKFTNAEFYVNKKEYEFAMNPIPLYFKSYEAPELGITRPFEGIAMNLVEGDTDGLFKVIVAGDTGESLGVHLYGQHVTDMIGEVSAAMTAEATVEELIGSIHPHPTVNEALGEAFMAAWNGKAINSL